MDDSNTKLVDIQAQEQAPPRNPGWFRVGDNRINRDGRPRGKKLPTENGSVQPDVAQRSDRLMRFFVRSRILISCLTQMKAPWMGLPPGFQFVDCRVDPVRKGVVFIIRSDKFHRIARGTPIPEFTPGLSGLVHCRLPDV
jgi:hypothetical protein